MLVMWVVLVVGWCWFDVYILNRVFEGRSLPLSFVGALYHEIIFLLLRMLLTELRLEYALVEGYEARYIKKKYIFNITLKSWCEPDGSSHQLFRYQEP